MRRPSPWGRALLLATLVTGCRKLEYLADGTPIVPFDAHSEPATTCELPQATCEIALEVWTDRMPPVPRGFDRQAGFPCYVALRLSVEPRANAADSIWVPALSLWSSQGESLLVSFPLVDLDGKEPRFVALGGASNVQLTNDRKRPRYTQAEPAEVYLPRLVIIESGRSHFFTLPPIHITAAH